MNLYDFYMTEVQSQWLATSWMIEGGLHIDVRELISTRQKLRMEIAELEVQLAESAGWTPNTKSNQDMERLLNQLSVVPTRTPPSRNFPRGQAKVAKDDLLNYAHKYPTSRDVLNICLEITKRRTIQSSFLGLALDRDDFYHPTYRLNGTKTGRFASEGADEGGPQGQNWPHHLLNLVIPDNPLTDELTEADLKQAEAMIVAWDAGDPFLMEAFTSGRDIHRIRGCVIFKGWNIRMGLPTESLLSSISVSCRDCSTQGQNNCTHSERFISKQSGHAFTYKMGPRKFVNKILPPAGVYLTEAEGRRIRDLVLTPHVLKWQDDTDLELKRSRWMTNLLGRRREFYGLHDSNGELLREALSWKAQSVVGVIAGRAISSLEISLRNIIGARLLTQRHDSVLVSHKRNDRDRVRQCIIEAFHSPINAHGRILNIPLEFKSGPNWRDLK